MLSCSQIDITEVKFHLPHFQIHLIEMINSDTDETQALTDTLGEVVSTKGEVSVPNCFYWYVRKIDKGKVKEGNTNT
jgi:hypothetical protein